MVTLMLLQPREAASLLESASSGWKMNCISESIPVDTTKKLFWPLWTVSNVVTTLKLHLNYIIYTLENGAWLYYSLQSLQ